MTSTVSRVALTTIFKNTNTKKLVVMSRNRLWILLCAPSPNHIHFAFSCLLALPHCVEGKPQGPVKVILLVSCEANYSHSRLCFTLTPLWASDLNQELKISQWVHVCSHHHKESFQLEKSFCFSDINAIRHEILWEFLAGVWFLLSETKTDFIAV